MALIGLTTEKMEVKQARKKVSTRKYIQVLDFRKFGNELRSYLSRRDRNSQEE